MSAPLQKVQEWFDDLPAPKDVGQSEYSVIHGILSSALGECETEQERRDMTESVLQEFWRIAQNLITQFRVRGSDKKKKVAR